MFRGLIMAIFRLYTKYLLSSYTIHTWAVYMGLGGGKVGTRSCICQKRWAMWVTSSDQNTSTMKYTQLGPFNGARQQIGIRNVAFF